MDYYKKSIWEAHNHQSPNTNSSGHEISSVENEPKQRMRALPKKKQHKECPNEISPNDENNHTK